VPASEASTLAGEVTAEWRQRWDEGEAAIRWPLFELWFYATAIAVALPLLTGVAVVLRKVPRGLRLLRPTGASRGEHARSRLGQRSGMTPEEVDGSDGRGR
jgi:hypothetical protein